MVDEQHSLVSRFRKDIAHTGKDYLHIPPSGDKCAHILFAGVFLGTDVIWDAHIMTLQYASRARDPDERQAGLRQFMEVGAIDNGIVKLTLGLYEPEINPAVLTKSIIMIRKYRLLQTGRHEFGEKWKPR